MIKRTSAYFSFTALSLVLLLFTLSACNDDKNEEPDIWTIEDTIANFQAIELTAGSITDVTLKLPSYPYNWDFRVIVPDTYNGGPTPLLIALHGGANNLGSGFHTNTECYVEPGFEDLNAIIISPNSQGKQWYEQQNIDQVMNLTYFALEYWPIDAERVAIGGYSDGGTGSWFFSEFFAETFSVGIAVSSSYITYNNEGGGRLIDTPLYVIHSDSDELFPLDSTVNWVSKAQEAGGHIQFEVAEGLSHYDPCDYVQYLQNASTWVNDSIWVD